MSAIRTSFEKELKAKLSQKSTRSQSEETILLKCFRFFDTDTNGVVDFDEFVKAIEKIGVQSFSKDELRELFHFYDTDGNETLDYKEFSNIIFGQAIPQIGVNQKKTIERIHNLLERVRQTLAKRGPGGIIGLGKQFRIADKNKSGGLDKAEFIYAMRDFGTGITDTEAGDLFEHFDRNKDGSINYDEFLLAIRGHMNHFRRNLVHQAFDILDADKSGELTISDLKGKYDARNHPEVKAGKKTEDQVLTEFLKTFESVYDLNRIDDDKVTRQEFIEYYNYVSASIDSDQYFELMMNNTWRINEGADKDWDKKGWAGDYRTPQKSSPGKFASPYKSSPGRYTQYEDSPLKQTKLEAAIDKVRSKLKARGSKGYIGIQRVFKIMDDNNDREISYNEFAKAMKDFGLGLTDEETRLLFQEFDVDRSGQISIDEFIRGIRGEMNGFRKNLVLTCFKILDKNGDGTLQVNDLKNVYNAKNHPDVKSKRKTEEEVLGEFLETFEIHHSLRGGTKDQKVTKEEFLEYYNNISANIDDDKYFENMIVNAYKLYQYDPRYREYAPANYESKNWNKLQKKTEAPYGVSNEKTNYATSSRPLTAQFKSTATTTYKAGHMTVEALEQLFRDKIAARGVRGMLSLGKLFRIIDDDNSHSISYPEFLKCCKDLRLGFEEADVKALFNSFDTNRNGEIDYDEFLRTIRGPLNPSRQKLVKLAFNKLDLDGNGYITLDEVRAKYNAKHHPDVKTGKRSEDEVLMEFLDTFEQHHAIRTGDFKLRDKKVTWEEFLEYYNNVSSSIDNDTYFELMMKNAWNLDNASYERGARLDFK